jgi:hypothetical protein
LIYSGRSETGFTRDNDDTNEQLIPNIYKLGRIEEDILTMDAELEIDV